MHPTAGEQSRQIPATPKVAGRIPRQQAAKIRVMRRRVMLYRHVMR